MPFRKQFDYETYKELYGLMSETLNIGFMLVDYEYNILEVNNRLLGMMSKTVAQKDELVGHSIREFFQNQDDFRRWLELVGAYDHKTTYQYEDTLRTLGASDRAVLVSVHLLPNVKRPGKRDGISTVLIADIEEVYGCLFKFGIDHQPVCRYDGRLYTRSAVVDCKDKFLVGLAHGLPGRLFRVSRNVSYLGVQVFEGLAGHLPVNPFV